MVLKGAVTALVTPFCQNGAVNEEKLASLIEFQIENGADGIVLLGTTGEAPTIHADEARRIITRGVETAAKRVPIIVGCGANDTSLAVSKAKCAQELGADALLVLTPYYNKANERGMTAHFLAVAEAVSIPILLYNVPSRTGCGISIGALGTLASHPNIIGIKEASGSIAYMTEVSALLSEDFAMWSGNDDMLLPALSLGASGVISVLSNLLPRTVHEITASFFAGRIDAARDRQRSLLPLMRALFSDVNPIPVKAAMNHLGFDVGGYRLPLCEMEPDARERLFSILDAMI